MKQAFIMFIAVMMSSGIFCQKKVRVLFIGDSYTSVNNLPLTVASLALANGDTLIYDSNTPGGTTLEGQVNNAVTLQKIALGGWDYVVLQAQSQEPSFPPGQVDTATYPYAHILDSLIHAADTCAETVFFLTWGRQYGDSLNCPYYPPICTYTGMQDRLTQSYLAMGQMNHATVAPPGEAWRTIISQNHPFDLYMADESHPSVFGTYLTAAVFYEVLFQKSVLNDSFVTAGIPDSNALQLRQAAHSMVSDSISEWFGYGHVPFAAFSDSIDGAQATFTSTCLNGENFNWDFGDGGSSAGYTASHTYHSAGSYVVTLTAYERCKTSVTSDSIRVGTGPSGLSVTGVQHLHIYPDPASVQTEICADDFISRGSDIIEIVNSAGQTVKSILLNSPQISVNVSDLTPGVYIVTGKTHPADCGVPLVISR